MDIDDIKGRLTKKIGPLPLWLWAVIIVGVGYVGYTVVKSRSAAPASSDGYDTTADTGDDSILSGYTTDFPNAGGSSGGLSTGSGGSQYVAPPQDLLSSQTLGMGQYTTDNPLPVRVEGVNPNLYTGTMYAQTQEQQPTTTAQAMTDNKAQERARLQAELDQALAAERTAREAQAQARAAADKAKTPAQKAAAAVSVQGAEQAKAAAAARSGTLRAQLAGL